MSKENRIRSLKGKIKISAVLKLETGLHIGSSNDFAPIGAVDSPFIRDPYTKQPIIPGSSIKGKIRTLLARSMSNSEWLNDIDQDCEKIKNLFGTAEKMPQEHQDYNFRILLLRQQAWRIWKPWIWILILVR